MESQQSYSPAVNAQKWGKQKIQCSARGHLRSGHSAGKSGVLCKMQEVAELNHGATYCSYLYIKLTKAWIPILSLSLPATTWVFLVTFQGMPKCHISWHLWAIIFHLKHSLNIPQIEDIRNHFMVHPWSFNILYFLREKNRCSEPKRNVTTVIETTWGALFLTLRIGKTQTY